jgi:hypothetical protein
MEGLMAIHYFHCTDGIDMLIDETGREISNSAEISSHARAVAAALMRAVPGYHEWWNWSVHVYDRVGAVEIFDFPTDRRQAA